jgi:protease I
MSFKEEKNGESAPSAQPNGDLAGLRVAMVATDGFEETELTEPLKALREAGARVDIVSQKKGQIQGFRHADKSIKVDVDRTLDELEAGDYDALMLPGGALNADALRVEPELQRFIKEMDAAHKPMAVICHAPWELVSARILDGRKLTSYHTIADDVRNAGATWEDKELVIDGNLVTSRQPDDLRAFVPAMLQLFARSAQRV